MSRKPFVPARPGAPRQTAPKPAAKPGGRPQLWSAEQWTEGVRATLQRLNASPLATQFGDELVAPLARYMGLLAHWNATFNLTALRDPQDMLTHHLADCLAIIPALQRHLDTVPGDGPIALLDVGSGGGLPGVVLAICCPRLHVSCVDTVGKKAAFIRQVAAELQLPRLKGEHARVEAMRSQYQVVTCRAFASLPDFTAWSRDRVAPGGIWLAMKGKQPDDELATLSPDVDVFHVEHMVVPDLDAERCLIWMRPRSAEGCGAAAAPAV